MSRDRLTARLNGLFETEGLDNIKLFVRGQPTNEQIWADVNKMQDTVAAGGFSLVDSIDKGLKKRKFDEPF